MPSVTLKRISTEGVEYITVDEDSPLLPKRSDSLEGDERMTRRGRTLILVITHIVLLVGLIATLCFRGSSFKNVPRDTHTLADTRSDGEAMYSRLFQRARVLVPENRRSVKSFWDYANQGPINVTYDERAILLNGERVLFLSGSMHPLRSTKETWERALDDAVHHGLNMVTIYVFWAAHQQFPDADFHWSFPGLDWDLASAIRAAANRGLFVHIRIGPYVCAEYSYGGIPEWVALNRPNMVMRRFNREWMDAMETYVIEIVRYLTEQQLWAYQGGPIVMGQIENELGGEEDAAADKARLLKPNSTKTDQSFERATIQDYADWCGGLAARVAPDVVWTMCNGLTAPNAINTCNGYGRTGCSTTWLESHGQSGRIQVDQPALWTEDEQGFQIWGEEASSPSDYFWGRTARDMTREGMQWFARGGSHLNYYMWYGGYNHGRAAASGISNMYASDACLCSSGQKRQPKYGHLQDFHKAITAVAPTLLNSKTALGKAHAIEYLTKDGQWELGSKQRRFVYRQMDGEVVFLENDAKENVKVRFFASQGGEQIFEMRSSSAALLVNGKLTFDSASINPRHQWYRRKSVDRAAKLLDWKTWDEPIGADASDERTVVSLAPIEQTKLMMYSKTWSDYAWYDTDINLDHSLTSATMQVDAQKASAISVYLDGTFIQALENHEHAEGNVTFSFSMGTIDGGQHKLSFLSESLGYFNLIGRWGASTSAKPKGISGDIILLGSLGAFSESNYSQSLVDGREWRSYPGLKNENTKRRRMLSTATSPPNQCTWSSTVFDSPNYDASIQSLFLDLSSGRGHVWLNDFDLGRYWNITRGETDVYSQRYYYLPEELLYTNGTLNKIVMFNALGGNNTATSLVLSWLESDQDSIMPDVVDWQDACI